jgi:hypothetical protein
MAESETPLQLFARQGARAREVANSYYPGGQGVQKKETRARRLKLEQLTKLENRALENVVLPKDFVAHREFKKVPKLTKTEIEELHARAKVVAHNVGAIKPRINALSSKHMQRRNARLYAKPWAYGQPHAKNPNNTLTAKSIHALKQKHRSEVKPMLNAAWLRHYKTPANQLLQKGKRPAAAVTAVAASPSKRRKT